MPDQWRDRAERASLPPTYRGVAAATGLGVETVRQAILGANGRRPTPATIRALAQAFRVTDATMDQWCGYHGTVGALERYTGPADSARLTPKQRKAVDAVILAMVDPADRGRREDAPPYVGDVLKYGLAANSSDEEPGDEEPGSPVK